MHEREVHRINIVTSKEIETINAVPYSVKYREGGLEYTTEDGWRVFRPWHGIDTAESMIMEIKEDD